MTNPDIVQKTLNKEDRYSHLLPIDALLCLFSPYLRHTAQGMVLKVGKNPRVVWDGSTKRTPMDVVMNEETSLDDELEITFGNSKTLFLTNIYNMRISHPLEQILLALADVKACFRHGHIHPDLNLTGAFGFLVNQLYMLATAMVFGSKTSAPIWEPFRRAIEAMTVVFANREDLLIKHKRFLDMIDWSADAKNSTGSFTKAAPCSINRGSVDSDGSEPPRPARMYVDDAMLAAIGAHRMRLTLAAMIEAIFVVMGKEDLQYRQCPLAMDKRQSLVVGPRQT